MSPVSSGNEKLSIQCVFAIVGGDMESSKTRGCQNWKSWLFLPSGALPQRSPVHIYAYRPPSSFALKTAFSCVFVYEKPPSIKPGLPPISTPVAFHGPSGCLATMTSALLPERQKQQV